MMQAFQGPGWNEAIAGLPNAHILQTWEWGQLKSLYGWKPYHFLWSDPDNRITAAAMILKRSVSGGLSVLYIPRGPLVDWQNRALALQVVQDLQDFARKQGAIFLKMDPEIVTGTGIPGSENDHVNQDGLQVISDLQSAGWRYAQDRIQFRNTACLDLTGTEEDWLARMKQKTRYNVRLALKKGVQVRTGVLEDLPLLYRMYAVTSLRDGFVIRPEEYYLQVWRSFIESGLAEPLIAEVERQAVAGLVLFAFAGRAWYLYGMSTEAHRDKMPNYLLQWEAMRRAKAQGCGQYDLWGAPDTFDESDSMWGVFRFKDGLGAQVVRTAGAYDFPSRPRLYMLYTQILPRILDVMRRRRKAQTRQEVSM